MGGGGGRLRAPPPPPPLFVAAIFFLKFAYQKVKELTPLFLDKWKIEKYM